MRIGVPKEIKAHEYRVGLTPESVAELTKCGHDVVVETGAGNGITAMDDAYRHSGASITDSAEAVFASSDLIVKVKEPQPSECAMLRDHHILFTYLHLAADPEQAAGLTRSGATCIAYETVTDNKNGLPLLRPMSQVAGRLSVQAGASALENAKGGRGVLLGGVPGVRPGRVVVIGGGVVGYHAALMAIGLQAQVTILDRNPEVLNQLSQIFEGRAEVIQSNTANLEAAISEADLVIGAVLVPGAAAPKLISREQLSLMQPGTVLIDVAIDQGGCFETSKPTTHDNPTYVVDGIVHYCVANMPGVVARTSTYALNNVTLPYVLALAEKGWKKALSDDAALAKGLNVHAGRVYCLPVAEALNLESASIDTLLNS